MGDTVSGSSSAIPQVLVDPSSPATNSAWVLRQGLPAGVPVGLLLSLTGAGYTYKLSYKATEGPVVRVALA